jgi:hypothetical protein
MPLKVRLPVTRKEHVENMQKVFESIKECGKIPTLNLVALEMGYVGWDEFVLGCEGHEAREKCVELTKNLVKNEIEQLWLDKENKAWRAAYSYYIEVFGLRSQKTAKELDKDPLDKEKARILVLPAKRPVGAPVDAEFEVLPKEEQKQIENSSSATKSENRATGVTNDTTPKRKKRTPTKKFDAALLLPEKRSLNKKDVVVNEVKRHPDDKAPEPWLKVQRKKTLEEVGLKDGDMPF